MYVSQGRLRAAFFVFECGGGRAGGAGSADPFGGAAARGGFFLRSGENLRLVNGFAASPRAMGVSEGKAEVAPLRKGVTRPEMPSRAAKLFVRRTFSRAKGEVYV